MDLGNVGRSNLKQLLIRFVTFSFDFVFHAVEFSCHSRLFIADRQHMF